MTYNRGLAQTLFHLFNLAWIGMIIISFVFGLVLLFTPSISGATYGMSFPITLELEPDSYTVTTQNVPAPLSTEISGVEGIVRLAYSDPPAGQFWWSLMLVSFIYLSSLVFVLYQLRMLFKTFATQSPLDEKSVYRFRAIGWVLVVGTLAANLSGYVSYQLSRSVLTAIEGIDWSHALKIDVSDYYGVFVGLIMLALAELFRYALFVQSERDTLQEEVETLV